MSENIWFLAAVSLMAYEVFQFYRLHQVQKGTHKANNWAPRVPYADFDYTNEKDIEEGNFLSVQRDGAAYTYTLPSGVLYKSYFPYSQNVESNYNLPNYQ
jgi:hypothetical protein